MKHDGQTKTVIFKEALRLFAEKGYDGASMSELARAVGIRKASLYSHFPGKEAILRDLLDAILKKHLYSVNSIVKNVEGSNRDKLEQIFKSYIYYCKDNQEIDFWTRFYYFPPEALKEEIHRKTHEVESYFEEKIESIFEEGIKQGEFHDRRAPDMMLSFYYMMIGFVLSLSDYQDRSPDEDIIRSLTVFMKGICK